MNMPIQWTSADIIKFAMIKVQEYIQSNNLKSLLIMQVHDELVLDIYPWEEQIITENLKKIMEDILSDKEIILKSDVIIWNTWKETK
jgi:DNA polymerase-1